MVKLAVNISIPRRTLISEASSTTPRQRAAGALGKIWWLPLLRGILLLVLGGYALFRPGMTMGVLTQIVGVFVIADGILSVIAGVIGEVPSRGWVILRGVLEVLVGAFVFANPIIVVGITATALIYILALSAILLASLRSSRQFRIAKSLKAKAG